MLNFSCSHRRKEVDRPWRRTASSRRQLRSKIPLLHPPPVPDSRRVSRNKSDAALASSLVFAVFLWGATNTGTKFVLGFWPPNWTGSTRFLCAGLFMLGLLKWTRWFGA